MNNLIENAPSSLKRQLLGDFLELAGEISKDTIRPDQEQQLETEIISAALQAKMPSAALSRVAKYHGLPVDLVQSIAQDLLGERGLDLEAEEFAKAIAAVKRIEETTEDQGLREWKLQNLARQYKRSPSQLWSCYEKALVNQAVLQPLSLKEFKDQHGNAIEWLVPGWIPKATTLLLHADGGVGKTLFVYQLLAALLAGDQWNGYQLKKGSCLLVQCDEPGIVTAERMEIRGIRDTADLQILTNWQAESLPRLAKWIEAKRPDLLIIDSLTTVNKASTFSENDTEYARPLLHLRDIANDYGVTVIIIHHSNAGGSARGTRAIHNSVSEVWNMKRGETLTERILSVEKTRLGRPPGDYKFQFDEGDFTFSYLGEAHSEGDQSVATEERIRLWMSTSAGTPYAAEEVSEQLALSKNTVRKALYELWAKGLCNRKRDTKQRFYSYWVESTLWQAADLADPSDLSRSHPDHLPDHLEKPDIPMASPASPPSDPRNRKEITLEKSKNSGSSGSLAQGEAENTCPAGIQQL
ncbi:MAG: AAA family ATPase [Leptolyngbyaceae cyanobacterium RM1_1_2]|nr:AAA family ATPase [Leptolyngbyaceae cyanobacterium RM1_1_2]